MKKKTGLLNGSSDLRPAFRLLIRNFCVNGDCYSEVSRSLVCDPSAVQGGSNF